MHTHHFLIDYASLSWSDNDDSLELMPELDEKEEGAEDNLDVDIFNLGEKATINCLSPRARIITALRKMIVSVRMVMPKVSCDTWIGAWGVPEPPKLEGAGCA